MKAENPRGASTEKPQTRSKPEVPVETFPPFPRHREKMSDVRTGRSARSPTGAHALFTGSLGQEKSPKKRVGFQTAERVPQRAQLGSRSGSEQWRSHRAAHTELKALLHR